MNDSMLKGIYLLDEVSLDKIYRSDQRAEPRCQE